MILFFYGTDNYRLKQKVRLLKEKFISSSLGDTNLSIIDGKTVTYDEIVRQVLAMPFLANSRLVIIENLLQVKKSNKNEVVTKIPTVQEKVLGFLEKVPSNTVLVFVEESMPDRRTALFKKLNQPKVAQELKPLEGQALKDWVIEEVKARGGEIENQALDFLIEYIGADLWRISNELEKLLNYDQKITVSNIKLFIRPQVQSNIFNLTDAISGKKQKQSLVELHKLLSNGEADLYLLSMIVGQFRNLLIAKDLEDRSGGKINQYDLAKTIGMHPYVAQKTLWQLKNFTLFRLKEIFKLLVDYDIKIKTGQVDSKTALDLLILKLGN